MREIRPSGSEGGGDLRVSPYPYQPAGGQRSSFARRAVVPRRAVVSWSAGCLLERRLPWSAVVSWNAGVPPAGPPASGRQVSCDSHLNSRARRSFLSAHPPVNDSPPLAPRHGKSDDPPEEASP
jgi:hypothetical protein